MCGEFYDYDSNICLTQCGRGNENYLYHTNINTNQDFICYPSCEAIQAGEYKYESKELGSNVKICSTQKPSDTDCSYYYLKSDGTSKCLTSSTDCKNMNYNYVLGKECKKECNDLYKLEEVDSTGLIKCFKTKEECLGSTGGGAVYYNTKLKKCWQNFPEEYYLSGTIITVVSNNKYEIVEECENYYFKNTNNNNHYQCVDKCSLSIPNYPYFVKGQKNCEDSCEKFVKYYYDVTNNEKECLDTCIGRANEYADEVTDTDKVKPCKSGCVAPKQHYNYDSKICLANCGEDKFTDGSDTNGIICYNSCKEIPDGLHIFEAADTNKCYTKAEIEVTPPPTDCPSFYFFLLSKT